MIKPPRLIYVPKHVLESASHEDVALLASDLIFQELVYDRYD